MFIDKWDWKWLYDIMQRGLKTATRESITVLTEFGRSGARPVQVFGVESLEHGFARARCEMCGQDILVAYSCNGRGV